MSNRELKTTIAKTWNEEAWDEAFSAYYDQVWTRVCNQHGDCIDYDVAGLIGVSEEQRRQAGCEALNALVGAEIDRDDSAELDAYMDEHLGAIQNRIAAEYFSHFRAAMDGAAPEHECWKFLAEYGVTADNLLEVIPE